MKPIAYYQNITGEPGEHENRVGSAYWNEGKWKNFIAPLLPIENRKDMTFIEIGANNGLFLKLAKEAGFRDVYGVESDPGAVKRGLEYRDSLGMDYKLWQREVGKDFRLDELPVADVILLSNVHYYFQLNDWIKLVDEMYHRTEYCLVITRPITKAKHHWRPQTSVIGLKYRFKEWEQIHAKYRIHLHHMDRKNDPSPRELQSLLFRSNLRRRGFDELLTGASGDAIKLERDELIGLLATNGEIDITKTGYYKTWEKRMSKHWTQKQMYDFVSKKVELFKSIKENGLKDPILLGMDCKVIDGGHRISVIKALGYESIMTRFI